MVSQLGFQRIVRAGAWYDVVSTAPLATPWTFSLMLSALAQLHGALGLPGAIPVYQPGFGLFGNLLGSLALVWAVLRLRWPEVRFGRHDAICRALYTVWMIYALMHGFSPLLLAYLIPEILLGVGQALPVREASGGRPSSVVSAAPSP